MFSRIKRFSVATRLRALVGTSVLCVLAVAAALMGSAYQQQKADREQSVRQAVDVAHGVLTWAHAQQTQGVLTTEQAQHTALAVIDGLRYGHNEYFWVNDMHPRVVHHPIKPELDGRDVSGLKDPNGVALFQAFVDTVKRDGAGFVPYQWPKPGAKDPVDKVSYVRGFAPWGWVVGSGLYTDDLQAAFRAQAAQAFVAVACVAAVMLALGELTARQLGQGVQAAVQRAQAIALGDIAQGQQAHPLARGHNEIAQLLQAMQHMSMRLNGTVTEVRESVDSVALASQQIAAGNTDLSHRTEQAAASLQHTAAAMEQLSSTVQHNSSSSSDAQAMAEEASAQAQRGGEVVAQVVCTMEAIHSSARKVSDIIAVIDGIAFQTNILALNAAVEAARAGEQGRGFAVVASEVRMLAQRSAQAAKEIKTLIQSSTEKVESGTQLVHDAGQRMRAIVSSVGRVNALIHQIAHATQEQTQGVGSVHGAVTQLDQMTQQNAALVEESAAAAGSLHEQARHLADVVSRFRLAGAV